jgi:hypothetical protein
MELEEIFTPFQLQITENSSSDGFLGDCLAKDKFFTNILGL